MSVDLPVISIDYNSYSNRTVYEYNDLSNLHRSIPKGVGLIILLSISIMPFLYLFLQDF